MTFERRERDAHRRAHVHPATEEQRLSSQASTMFALQHAAGNRAVQTFVEHRTGAPVQRRFDAAKPSTYDDDGGHALAMHGPAVSAAFHQSRAENNPPTYSSSGWASEAMMKKAVLAANAARRSWGDNKTTKGKYKAKCTVNVDLAGAGYSYVFDPVTRKGTKVTLNTAVVVFSIDRHRGYVDYLVTAYPGAKANAADLQVSA